MCTRIVLYHSPINCIYRSPIQSLKFQFVNEAICVSCIHFHKQKHMLIQHIFKIMTTASAADNNFIILMLCMHTHYSMEGSLGEVESSPLRWVGELARVK